MNSNNKGKQSNKAHQMVHRQIKMFLIMDENRSLAIGGIQSICLIRKNRMHVTLLLCACIFASVFADPVSETSM